MSFSLQCPRKTKLLKYILRGLAGLLVILVMGCLIPTKWIGGNKVGCEFQVCVEDVGIHTNIIVPVKNEAFNWHQYLSLKELNSGFGRNYEYLSFSWGDRSFYTETPTLAEFKLSNALDALLIPGASVMYVQGITNLSQNTSIKCVKVNRQDYLNLVNYVQNSFQVDSHKKAIFAVNGYNANSTFYDAKGTYSVFRTCNVWTGEALRAADLNTPVWTALAPAIMWHLSSDCSSNSP
jgi:uncharacterized protein (TIGR02117 family)